MPFFMWIFFTLFFFTNVFIETIPLDVFRFINFYSVKVSKKWPQSWNSAENRLFLQMSCHHFFCKFFFTLFSSSMYSWRPYPETFFDLSLFIMWKSQKMALKSHFGQKWRPNSYMISYVFSRINFFPLEDKFWKTFFL